MRFIYTLRDSTHTHIYSDDDEFFFLEKKRRNKTSTRSSNYCVVTVHTLALQRPCKSIIFLLLLYLGGVYSFYFLLKEKMGGENKNMFIPIVSCRYILDPVDDNTEKKEEKKKPLKKKDGIES